MCRRVGGGWVALSTSAPASSSCSPPTLPAPPLHPLPPHPHFHTPTSTPHLLIPTSSPPVPQLDPPPVHPQHQPAQATHNLLCESAAAARGGAAAAALERRGAACGGALRLGCVSKGGAGQQQQWRLQHCVRVKIGRPGKAAQRRSTSSTSSRGL